MREELLRELKKLPLLVIVLSLLGGMSGIPMGFVGFFGHHTPADFWNSFLDFYKNLPNVKKSASLLIAVAFITVVFLVRGIIHHRIKLSTLLLFPLSFPLVGVYVSVWFSYQILGCYLRLWLSGLWPALKDLPEKHAYSYLAFFFYFIWFAIIARTFLPKIYRENDL